MGTERVLYRYLDPLSDALSPQAARAILGIAPRPEDVLRVEELGRKANAGTLAEDEQEEYRALADAGTMVALLKAKARRALALAHDAN